MNDTLRKIICMEVNRKCYNLDQENNEQECQIEKMTEESTSVGVTNIEISKQIFTNDTHSHFKVIIHSGI